MAKRRLNPDEIRAAVEVGPPPHSVNHETDKKWHAEQNRWLAKWTERRLPPDSGDSGSSRRDQWRDRKQQHARLLRAAEKEPSASLKRQRKAAATPAVTHSGRVHAGPSRLKRPKPPPEGGNQQAYELAMGMYGIARDTRSKMSRRTKSEDAERKRDARAITAMTTSASIGSATTQSAAAGAAGATSSQTVPEAGMPGVALPPIPPRPTHHHHTRLPRGRAAGSQGRQGTNGEGARAWAAAA